MSNDIIDLDELMGDEFLDSLDENSAESETPERPSWVVDEESNTTYKSWQAIMALKEEKEKSIKKFGKIANKKTPKSVYEMSKSEVAKKVKISPQSIFRASKFSPLILSFFDEANAALLAFHEKEQIKQRRRQLSTGIRAKKKDMIVKSHQDIEKELNQLKAKTTKEILDLAIDKMPLDLKLKLGL